MKRVGFIKRDFMSPTHKDLPRERDPYYMPPFQAAYARRRRKLLMAAAALAFVIGVALVLLVL